MDDVTSEVSEDVMRGHMDDVTKTRHISELILNSCLLNPARNYEYETAFTDCVNHSNNNYYSLPVGAETISGSCAEMYIVPAVSCIGDLDLMYSMRDGLAVCDGTSALKYIGFNDGAEVATIETSGCPNGYVDLRFIGRIHFNWDTEKFEYFVTNDTTTYYFTRMMTRVFFKDQLEFKL